jgi:hypothetical protein
VRLSDDQISILRELNADARHTEEALAELVAECGDFQTVLCELADADAYDPADCYPPWEWDDTTDGTDTDYPF